MQLIDTHVHLNFDVFTNDLEEICQRWREQGIVRLVHSCVTPSEFPTIQALAHRFPELYFAVGLHPLDVDQWTEASAREIHHLATSDPKVVAIGETGLDYFKASNRPQQEQAFWLQLQIAQRLNLPVIIHCREAAQPMADLLRAFWREYAPVAGVMHCWGGTPAETQWFLDLGFYISFSGTVTFKKATSIHESACMVPEDRLLVETDCPFLSPSPERGKYPNEPARVHHVATQIAKLRGVSLEHLATQTTENACQLFGLTLGSRTPPPPFPVSSSGG
ncbi:YchF/TatD family DNA exonuclease [Synechococcales cyanobacterium C]|uniref:D-aminoacyl-tRNA deacylase n=1 Tax=Petrachloros mirabilis ULC683 TaxID=2781853 RepID=A0A8K2AGV1_9CYAN|nr:TatD family hydrolase [Petrachloros mirabilis]NCJ05479.1 YchF/TatD family DNA exonuclease [Petrachloros mirabilis ULC683]